jgi:hypothetical protein
VAHPSSMLTGGCVWLLLHQVVGTSRTPGVYTGNCKYTKPGDKCRPGEGCGRSCILNKASHVCALGLACSCAFFVPLPAVLCMP